MPDIWAKRSMTSAYGIPSNWNRMFRAPGLAGLPVACGALVDAFAGPGAAGPGSAAWARAREAMGLRPSM